MELIKEMFEDELAYLINNSSYAKKRKLGEVAADTERDYLESVYKECREYACKSIVNSLMDFRGMTEGNVYHLDCNKDNFFILARVRTNWEETTVEETAEKRTFLSFSILTEKNLSHFPGRTIYGYRTGVNPSMIGYICSHDADTTAYAATRLELAEMPEELLDIEDLCELARANGTYCQVSIRSKTKSYIGPMIKTEVLRPEVVIAIDMPTRDDLLAAAQRGLPLLVIHRGAQTIMNTRDLFLTPELSCPIYL